jgi:hypothetical protein
MNDLLNHAAALELVARDILAPVCGFGVAWCVIGVEAVLALAVMAAIAAAGWLVRR